MFDPSWFVYSWAHWATFFSAAIALELVPGPDYLFIAGQSARHGPGHGFAAMFGIWCGAVIHIVATAVGLAALLAQSAAAFSLIKWLGAAYLVWLGWQALAGSDAHAPAAGRSGRRAPPSRVAVFRQGLLVDLLNPKVALFFVAFIPQFVVPGAGPAAAQIVLHGGLLIVVAACFEPVLILVGARLAAALRTRRRVTRWAERGLGVLFIGLGLRLAVAHR